MKQIQLVTFAIIVLLAINQCATLEQLVQKPDIEFVNVQAEKLDLMEGTFLFNFNITNPNPVGITTSHIKYDLKLNQQDFMSNKLDKKLSVDANARSAMSIPVSIRYLDFFKSLKDLLTNDTIKYDLDGSVGVGPLSIPYRASGTIDLPRMPNVFIESIRISKFSAMGAFIDATMNISNPNNFDLSIGALDYFLRIGKQEIMRGNAANVKVIPGGKSGKVSLQSEVSFLDLGAAASTMLKGSRVGYELSGKMKLTDNKEGRKEIPFLKKGKVQLIR